LYNATLQVNLGTSLVATIVAAAETVISAEIMNRGAGSGGGDIVAGDTGDGGDVNSDRTGRLDYNTAKLLARLIHVWAKIVVLPLTVGTSRIERMLLYRGFFKLPFLLYH
jgi:hypothetical protein